MSGSGWFGKIKSGAKSLQETAKNRLEKVSESLDQKLKEARDDLDRLLVYFNFLFDYRISFS